MNPQSRRDSKTDHAVRPSNKTGSESDWDVFISAQSRDFPVAEQVRQQISEWGLRVFFCEDSAVREGASNFSITVYNALEASDHFVFIASAPPVEGASLVSGWCRAEIDTFINERNSGRKEGNVCSILIGGMTIPRLPLALRNSLAFHQTEVEKLRPFLAPLHSRRTLSRLKSTRSRVVPVLAHPLHVYPRGPLVPFESVPPGLINYCAAVFREPVQAELALRRANFDRLEADPGGRPEQQCVLPEEIANPANVASLTYWNQLISVACLKSPRMMGAILEQLDLERMPEQLHRQVTSFQHFLQNLS
jgi:hypothetical protein